MILYLHNGRYIETEGCELLTYEEYPQKYAYAVGQNYYPRLLYSTPGDAMLRSNPLTLKELRRMKWAGVQSVNTGTESTKRRQAEKHEREEHEKLERREWLKVHRPDQYDQMLYDERKTREANVRRMEEDKVQRETGWVLRALRASGRSIRVYSDQPSTDPTFRVYNIETGEFDDEGPFSKNHGLFRLSELMEMLEIENGRIHGKSVHELR